MTEPPLATRSTLVADLTALGLGTVVVPTHTSDLDHVGEQGADVATTVRHGAAADFAADRHARERA